MIYVVINAPVILAATLCSLAFGVGYYRLVDRDRTASGWRWLLALAFVAEYWFATILAGALILAPAEAGRWTMAVGTAVVIWVGFVVPVLVATQRYRGLPARAVAVDCGHWLGAMIVQAVLLQAIGLTPPPG